MIAGPWRRQAELIDLKLPLQMQVEGGAARVVVAVIVVNEVVAMMI